MEVISLICKERRLFIVRYAHKLSVTPCECHQGHANARAMQMQETRKRMPACKVYGKVSDAECKTRTPQRQLPILEEHIVQDAMKQAKHQKQDSRSRNTKAKKGKLHGIKLKCSTTQKKTPIEEHNRGMPIEIVREA